MKDIRYQKVAVDDLVKKAIELLNLQGDRMKIIFEAPTGSGKTVMASEMLDRLTTELAIDPQSAVKEVAFIWIAPNKLHEQSYLKMRNFFSETRVLSPVMYDELDHSADGYIHPGEVLFVNWESIRQDKNVMVRDSENGASLYDICRRTKLQGLPIVVVVDEEHMYAGRTATQAQKVLKNINPKLEIRISATPNPQQADAWIKVPREKVIREEMIKEGIIINPNIDVNSPQGSLNQLLLRHALDKRDEIAASYKKLGVGINPLLLVQLPNDNSASMDKDDTSIAEEVKSYLNTICGINTDNGRLAVWLSGEKENVAGLERPNNATEVLLFKQAIALGWDCPRAAVLLIFRKMESFQFTMQTVGRILRMPEQRHYTDPHLNKGYVYTDLSKDKVQIVADDMSYISQELVAYRRKELNNVLLRSEYSEYKSADRNRLGPDFRNFLEDAFNRLWLNLPVQATLDFGAFEDEDEVEVIEEFGELGGVIADNRKKAEAQGVKFDVRNIVVEIPEDVFVESDAHGIIDISNKQRAKYARTVAELTQVFDAFCASMLGAFERKHSLRILSGYILETMEKFFNLFEADAMKVILYKGRKGDGGNQSKFEHVIRVALNNYAREVAKRRGEAKRRAFVSYDWEVPEERWYNSEKNTEIESMRNHALLPFIQLNTASSPEREFEAFLEANSASIDWWYKNGDSGKQHYSISYEASTGEKELFYPDFVIRLRNGRVFLFDTKTPGSDPEAPAKHNALHTYMNSDENRHLKLQGGILIKEGSNWMFSEFPIEDTENLQGWSPFFPDVLNSQQP